MLENKILINLYVLSMDNSFEIYVPINEKVGNIANLLNCSLFDSINIGKNNILLNADTGLCYKNNELVRNTDMKNGAKIILI